jgi:hypothetical protein
VEARSQTNCSLSSTAETDSSTVGLSVGEAVGLDVLASLPALARLRALRLCWTVDSSGVRAMAMMLAHRSSCWRFRLEDVPLSFGWAE